MTHHDIIIHARHIHINIQDGLQVVKYHQSLVGVLWDDASCIQHRIDKPLHSKYASIKYCFCVASAAAASANSVVMNMQ